MITLEKKDAPITDTLAAALNGVLAPKEQKQIARSVTVQAWEMYVKNDVTDTGRGIPESAQATISEARADFTAPVGFLNILSMQQFTEIFRHIF